MEEYIFENFMTSNITITIKAETLGEAITILKNIVKESIEDYTYPKDLYKVLS
tara:strand:- start:70866 stop:71024 length:159 start_codon:yes stop_codon:yes gene_type:complete